MRPFLLLSTRPEDAAAHGEWAAVARFGGLAAGQLEQVRVETAPVRTLDLEQYSGVILGGGPYNSSDPHKSPTQHRVEADLAQILDEVFAHEIPFLGLCYGIGTVTGHLGGLVDRTFGEPVGAVDVQLTDAGRDDPLLAGVPTTFRAFVGHKEAVAKLPADAVLLATGEACPVQMYRVGSHCWVTQFHPELDAPGIGERIRVYKHAGYFLPEETDALLVRTAGESIATEVHGIIERFVQLHQRD